MRNLRLARFSLAAAAIALVAGFAAWFARASAQQDFAAYYVAGAARRLGLDPYVNQAGAPANGALWDGVAVFAHSRFLYPPLVAELFRPLAALPYATAKAIFTALSVGAWVVAGLAAARAFDRDGRAPAAALAAGALFFPLYLHLERGQIDLLALVLLLLTWSHRERAPAAGAALAAAAMLKPALGFALPVVLALGRWRVALAAVACAAALAGLTAIVCGPALLAEYVTAVLPRAARYGEGGTEEMLLPPARRAAVADALDSGTVALGGARFPLAAWEGPASASLPRLLAPRAPTIVAGTLPAGAALLALVAAARAVRRRRRPASAEATLFFAAALASVVVSPAGWVMGLVVALPLVPLLAGAWSARSVERRAAVALAVALGACACPPPFAGWAALAGTSVVVSAAAAAVIEP